MNYSAPVSKTIEWSRSTGTRYQTGLGVGDGACSGHDFNGRGNVWFQRPIVPGGQGMWVIVAAVTATGIGRKKNGHFLTV